MGLFLVSEVTMYGMQVPLSSEVPCKHHHHQHHHHDTPTLSRMTGHHYHPELNPKGSGLVEVEGSAEKLAAGIIVVVLNKVSNILKIDFSFRPG